jgi:alkylation response protein AidB-like acyl-CoA dehydrogenase
MTSHASAHSADILAHALPTIRDFVRERVIPLEPKLLAHDAGVAEDLRRLREEVRRLGLWAPHLPVTEGGLGLSLPDFARVSEELGRSPLGHYAFNCQAPDVGNMEILMQFGTDAQKERFLRPLARGEVHSCFAMTEPDNAGSNPVLLDGRARLEGGEWVIDAHKWFTTAADGAGFAIAMVVTEPEAPPHLRASMILVPLPRVGFTLVRNLSVMGEAGFGHFSHGEVRFEGVRVPEDHLLGMRGAGFVIAQERLGPGRIHHCMRWIGICERAFDLMCRRAATRAIGPGKPLGTRQMVQEWIAESRAEIDAARLMVLHAASRIERDGQAAARDEISAIKFFVAGVLGRVLDRALQTHGGLGMTDDTPIAFWYRHERAARIYDGADEVHKASLARRILRRYGLEVG